jgi:hypothetical protein
VILRFSTALQTTGKYYHQRPVEPFLRSIYYVLHRAKIQVSTRQILRSCARRPENNTSGGKTVRRSARELLEHFLFLL